MKQQQGGENMHQKGLDHLLGNYPSEEQKQDGTDILCIERTPVVGMQVFLRPNKHDRDQAVKMGTLTKIGRKYYTVEVGYREYRFDKERLLEVSEYGYHCMLYFSFSTMSNDIQRDVLYRIVTGELNKSVDSSRFTLAQMRAIADILGIREVEEK